MISALKAISLLPLVVLTAGGGLLSFCNLFEVVGLHPHLHADNHHPCEIHMHECGEHTDSEAPVVPCTEDCIIDLEDADIAKNLITLSGPPSSRALMILLEDSLPDRKFWEKRIFDDSGPPGGPLNRVSPPFTGRFLL